MHSGAPKPLTLDLSLEHARDTMSLAATTTLVAALWMINSCTASPDCSASNGNLATEFDRSGEGSENTSCIYLDIVSCATIAYWKNSERFE